MTNSVFLLVGVALGFFITCLLMRRRIQWALEKLVRQVSHNIKGPLASIEVFKAFFRNAQFKDDESREFFNLLDLSTKRIHDILENSVRKYHREFGLSQHEKREIELTSLVIEVCVGGALLVVDDDASMREQWRLLAKKAGLSTHLVASLEKLQSNVDACKGCRTAIVDYSYDNSEFTGEDVVRFLQSKGFAKITLCTSDHWRATIKELAARLGVALCPKPLPEILFKRVPATSPTVQVVHTASGAPVRVKYDAILIDDEKLVRSTWQALAQIKGKTFLCFASAEEFIAQIDHIDRESKLFIDSILSDTVRGEDVAKELHERYGFKEIYLTTGRRPDEFTEPMPWIKEIMGKKPPFTSN